MSPRHGLVRITLLVLSITAPPAAADLHCWLTASVRHDPTTGMYTYRYVLTSTPDSDRVVRRFSLGVTSENTLRAPSLAGGWIPNYWPTRARFELIEWVPSWLGRDDRILPGGSATFVIESPHPPGLATYWVEHANPNDPDDGQSPVVGRVTAPGPSDLR